MNPQSISQEFFFSFKRACVSVVDSSPTNTPHVSKMTHSPLIVLFFIHGRYGREDLDIEELSQHFRCVTYDLPGFGRSFIANDHYFLLLEHVQLALALLDTFPEQSNIIVIGHDIGGAIAQLAALHSKVPIKGLVLIHSEDVTRSLRKNLGKSWRLNFSDSFPRDRYSLSAIRALEESWPLHYEQLVWKEKWLHLKCSRLVFETMPQQLAIFYSQIWKFIDEIERANPSS